MAAGHFAGSIHGLEPGGGQPNQVHLGAAAVCFKPWPDGNVMGEGKTSARLVPDPDPLGGQHFCVEVPLPGYKAWTDEDKQQTRILADFLGAGGTMVVLSTPTWNWLELCEVKIGQAQRFSRVFSLPECETPYPNRHRSRVVEPVEWFAWHSGTRTA